LTNRQSFKGRKVTVVEVGPRDGLQNEKAVVSTADKIEFVNRLGAASLAGRGRVCDVGCGPGHVGRYLAEHGVDVFGLDLSPGMVALARDLNPAMRFEQGDMLALNLPDGALGGIVAFYSLIHLERAVVGRALAEMARVLIPGGLLLLAFHGGEGEVHAEDWFGCGISIDATLFQPAEMAASMVQAGFDVEEVVTREPYEFEYPSRRVYARGTKRP